ncbi:MAG: pilus assembly protein PilM [Candidatus Yonathbacteria bacterium]|nr:pilus assembly protein PilM [Candidatus Yonathbacteria bacterium]
MNILNLLTKEKRVAGIEISDSVVRIAFFRPKKKGVHTTKEKKPEEDLVLIEEPIAANIIADGVVTDINLLGKTLKGIWEKAHLGTDYAIVAIPDDKIYSKIFSFPKSVDGVRLTEAMRLAISFQLPMKTEDLYLDWERVQSESHVNEILLSTIPRTVAQSYVAALELAGIKTLALESHLASIARAVKLTPKETTVFSKKTPDGATIFALEDGVLRFSRTLPLRVISEDKIPSEIKKLKMALETQLSAVTKKIVHEEELVNAKVRDDYAGRTELSEPKSKWLVPLGAAIRAKIPEGEDNLVSLLPVGTEEAYAYQRATTFIVLMRNLIIGVSLFFVVAYLATYLSMLSLSQRASERITTLSAVAIPPKLAEKEEQIRNTNAITETGAMFLAQMPVWSTVLTELLARTPSGITVSMFTAPNIAGRISLAGTAVNRPTLNNYKKILQDSPLLSGIELPLTNLEQEANIPFNVSFSLRDPGAIYYTQAH